MGVEAETPSATRLSLLMALAVYSFKAILVRQTGVSMWDVVTVDRFDQWFLSLDESEQESMPSFCIT